MIASSLVDTNVLLRSIRLSDPQHGLVSGALKRLVTQGTRLCYATQNIAELWNTMTRPVKHNGLGLSVSEAEREVQLFEKQLSLLADSTEAYYEWRRLLVRHEIRGVRVHDARLAAVMYVHGVSHILTLNTSDFARFDGITALHPSAV